MAPVLQEMLKTILEKIHLSEKVKFFQDNNSFSSPFLSHLNCKELKKGNMKAIFLSLNVTSLIQSIRSSVASISGTKRIYRCKGFSSILEKIDDKKSYRIIKIINVKYLP